MQPLFCDVMDDRELDDGQPLGILAAHWRGDFNDHPYRLQEPLPAPDQIGPESRLPVHDCFRIKGVQSASVPRGTHQPEASVALRLQHHQDGEARPLREDSGRASRPGKRRRCSECSVRTPTNAAATLESRSTRSFSGRSTRSTPQSAPSAWPSPRPWEASRLARLHLQSPSVCEATASAEAAIASPTRLNHCSVLPLTGSPAPRGPQLTWPVPDGQFLPGQWLDVFVPGTSKPGGFTITSAPSRAQEKSPPPARDPPADGAASSSHAAATGPAQEPYLELAVQKSPDNPPAQYLWRPASEILSSELRVRVGGSFVWPPPGVQPTVSSHPVSSPPRLSLATKHPAQTFLVSHARRPPPIHSS